MGFPLQDGKRRRRFTLVVVVVALLAIPATMVLATHTFSDVPTGAFYHDDVDAISNAGVTAGCGSGKYCPNNAVTRGQMAVFLNQLGALGNDTSPVVDALSTNGVQTNFSPTAVIVPAAENEPVHCEARSTLSGTDIFAAFAQLADPPSGEIWEYEVWIDYVAPGLDPDQFNICVRNDSGNDLPDTGPYAVQLTTLEYIGQQNFASASEPNIARVQSARNAG
jgi:hypothetical protein